MESLTYDDYSEEIINTSFQILKKFQNLMDERGIQPIIIGGWAVEAFKKSLGSKDIDVVMPNWKDIKKLLAEEFFSENLIEEVQTGWPLHYEKEIFVKGKTKKIICEIFNAEEPRQDYEKLGIQLHWSIIQQFQEIREINGLQIRVPKRELLLITKIIAAVDRSARYDRTESAMLPAKIWKDYHDVAVLIVNQKLDKEFLKKYLETTNVLKYLDNFLARYKQTEYERILKEDLGSNYQEIVSALKV